MDCNKIDQPESLVYYLKQNSETDLDDVFKCIHAKFFGYVKGLFNKFILSNRTVTRYREKELTNEAFEEGFLKFHEYIRANGFETDQGATIKTFFTQFCINKLLQLIKDLERFREKHPVQSGKNEFDNTESTKPLIELLEYEEMKKEEARRRKAAFDMLDKRCAKLIIWRKVDKLSNEEIARRMGTIQPGTVNNEVHRCFNRLWENYKNLK